MSSDSVLAASAAHDQISRVHHRDRFFLGMSAGLLAILLIGFSPTLYMRAFFDVPPIPLYLHVHGIVVTSWFVWLVFQASLVTVRRTDLHRRIGIAGAGLAVAVVIAGPMATRGLVSRLETIGLSLESDIQIVSWVVSLNSTMILGFVVFLASALLLRRRPDAHKRLMLFASVSLIPPAIARISFWPIFSWATEPPLVTTGSLLLVVPIIAHDLIIKGRLHIATVLGTLGVALVMLTPLILRDMEVMRTFVRALA